MYKLNRLKKITVFETCGMNIVPGLAHYRVPGTKGWMVRMVRTSGPIETFQADSPQSPQSR